MRLWRIKSERRGATLDWVIYRRGVRMWTKRSLIAAVKYVERFGGH